MKVLHIFDHSLPLQSGYSFRSHNILKSQKKAGLTPVALTSPKHEASLKHLEYGHVKIEGIPYFRSGPLGSRRIPIYSELRTMQRLAHFIFFLARQERPLIIHVHSPVLNVLPAIIAASLLRLPVVYEIRAFWEDAGVDHGTYKKRGLKYRLVRYLETVACRIVKSVIVICEGLKSDLLLRNISEKKIWIAPNAIEPDEFQIAPRNDRLVKEYGLDGSIVLGFLGSFYHYEGLDLLIDAVAKLAREVPNLKLLLAGGGPARETLEDQVRTLGIEKKVVFTGRIPHEEVGQIYSLVDILVFPREKMRLTDLVTPLKPLEAMAMRKAVIASDVGGHQELIQDGNTGVLFQAGNPVALAKAIKQLITSPGCMKTIAENGYKWVRSQRTWDSTELVYSEMYRQVISEESAL